MIPLPLDIRRIIYSFYIDSGDEFRKVCKGGDMTLLPLFKMMRDPVLQNKSLVLDCFLSACMDGRVIAVEFLCGLQLSNY